MAYECEINLEGEVFTIILDETTSDGEANE